ncbi:aminotransferase class I/II-fold pyridoxal phosphate-dependent enzyme [Chitinasiproducens palmae]|uniref:DNA-binding transcriptional regulator, MocR family, contains an aminotransferase domain n=1 Tax=Chitinasiproducens palmae TaxID=1770053 RepID=A0A1H2PU44_9BURK|nr:aminotransferase class I/II-fold pyridoxal phosphate-dependent enzyme [Chitinasiproducens palmae]SDV50693.1 DNA-binding transcriptional regulator, MocR family, contains an aminotransferase domain [Chitinasiproducens palmae]
MHEEIGPEGSGQLAEAEWLARYVTTDGAGDLAMSIGDLVRSGRLESGARLPTVRALGACMGVSPATVAAAWSKLRRDGIIETRRRGGTVVVYRAPAPTERWHGLAQGRPLDLAQGLIDHALLPDLGPALQAALGYPMNHGAGKDHMIAPLREAVASTWPFKPAAWTTASSGTEGALLAVKAAIRYTGTTVIAIESPTSPRLLDLCRTLGADLMPVACDEAGPIPASLREALQARPGAFIYQPRAQIPLGHGVGETRTQALAEALQRVPDTIAVEDDFLGPLARQPSFSIGAHLPQRTLYVRTYCNAFGIDLRTCVIGGAAPLIDTMRRLRSHGAAMNSRILQGALAFLLTDADALATASLARQRYASRRLALAEALRLRGFEAGNRDGLGIWLAVPRESEAIIELAQRGISVGAGSRCFPGETSGQFLRLSTGRLPDDPGQIREIADAFAVGAPVDAVS